MKKTVILTLKKYLACIFLFSIFGSAASGTTANTIPAVKQTEPFQQGKEYTRLPRAIDKDQSGAISVKIFFWYGCPHCYQLEKMINRWKATEPLQINLERVPVIFGSPWKEHARLYYTLKVMNLEEKSKEALFIAIQKNPSNLTTLKSADQFLRQIFNIDSDQFGRIYNSFQVNNQLKKATQQSQAAQLRGIPSIIINNTYRVNTEKLQTLEQALNVASYLIAKLIKEQSATSNILS